MKAKSDRKTVEQIKANKAGNNNGKEFKPLVCLTAYSAPMAEILDNHCDLLLVGDSIGMALYGMENTLGVTLDMMIAHGKAVAKKTKSACVIVDMPYGTYEESAQQAYNNASKIIKETGCDGVKLEGGQDMAQTITYLVDNGIPVMAHIGLKPQSVVKEGGYKVKGKNSEESQSLIDDIRAVEKAGAFAVVIEGTIEPVARKLTDSADIPTIGIGASSYCDGQILVTEDMLGLLLGHTPKFAKKYANLAKDIDKAVQSYANDVRSRSFPNSDYVYK